MNSSRVSCCIITRSPTTPCPPMACTEISHYQESLLSVSDRNRTPIQLMYLSGFICPQWDKGQHGNSTILLVTFYCINSSNQCPYIILIQYTLFWIKMESIFTSQKYTAIAISEHHFEFIWNVVKYFPQVLSNISAYQSV